MVTDRLKQKLRQIQKKVSMYLSLSRFFSFSFLIRLSLSRLQVAATSSPQLLLLLLFPPITPGRQAHWPATPPMAIPPHLPSLATPPMLLAVPVSLRSTTSKSTFRIFGSARTTPMLTITGCRSGATAAKPTRDLNRS